MKDKNHFFIFLHLFKNSLRDRRVLICFIFAILMFVVGIIANISLPFLFKKIADKLYSKHYDLIMLLAFGYGLIWVISQAHQHIKEFFSNRVELRITAVLIEKGMDKIFALPMERYYTYNMGEIVSLIQRAQQSIPSMIVALFFYIVPTVVEIAIVASLLFIYYPHIYSLSLLLTLFTFLGYNIFFSKKITALSNEYVQAESETTSKVIDLLMTYETIKYFSIASQAKSLYSDQFKSWENRIVRSRNLSSLVRAGQVTVLGVGVICLATLSVHGVQTNLLTAGSFILFIGYLLQFISPLNIIGYTLKDFKKSIIDVKELLDVLSIKEEKDDGVILYLSSPPTIEFQNVNFYYNQKHVLQDLSFCINPCDKLVIMGKTGTGKTTIAKCLLKLYTVHSGLISIDKTPIQQISSSSIREIITYCPQEVQLINASLYENLKFTSPDASDEAISRAIKYAQLEVFLERRLNNNIHSPIGERGVQISGGEKQRIGLARLFLKKPTVCILDEPFSSLDKKTAEDIYEKLMDYFHEATIIIITHQLLEKMKENTILYVDKHHKESHIVLG